MVRTTSRRRLAIGTATALVVLALILIGLGALNEARGIGHSTWTIRLQGLSPHVRALRMINSSYERVTVQVDGLRPGELVEVPCLLRTYVTTSWLRQRQLPDTNTVEVWLVDEDGRLGEGVYGLAASRADFPIIEATLVPREQRKMVK